MMFDVFMVNEFSLEHMRRRPTGIQFGLFSPPAHVVIWLNVGNIEKVQVVFLVNDCV